MKKRRQFRYQTISGVRFYLDDVERVFEVLKESGKPVSITTEEYEFDSVDDLKATGQLSLPSLTIKTEWPGVSMELNRKCKATLSSLDDSLEARGLLDTLREIVEQRRSLWRAVFYGDWLWLALMFLAPIWFLLFQRGRSVPIMKAIPIVAVWAVSLLVLIYQWVRPGHGVILVRRAERPSFLNRHAADILKATIAAVIGGLLTALILKAVDGQKVSPPQAPVERGAGK